jgi:hypothetical protein
MDESSARLLMVLENAVGYDGSLNSVLLQSYICVNSSFCHKKAQESQSNESKEETQNHPRLFFVSFVPFCGSEMVVDNAPTGAYYFPVQ